MPKERAPWNYECRYKDNCPHLEGLSTYWVWGEYQRSYREHTEHWRVREEQNKELEKALKYIGELEKENQEIKAKWQALHRRQFKKNLKGNTENSQDPPETEKKNRGAPKGHQGWYRREPDHIDKTIIVEAPEICPHCSCARLTPLDEIKEHLQEDIVLQPRTLVTNFRHHQAFCPKCNRPVIKAATGELINCRIGPTTKAAAIYLRYGLRIPYRKVQELFDVLFGMPFVPASAMAFDRKAAHIGNPLYEDLKDKLRCLPVAHADETHWRENGINHYVWYGGNNDIGLFHIDRYRSTEIAQSIFGDKFGGVLVTDGYASYNGVNPKARQSCLAHLITKSKNIKEEILLKGPEFQDKKSLDFCDSVSVVFKKACEIGRNINEGKIKWEEAGQFKKILYSNIKSICAKKLDDEKSEILRLRLLNPKKEYNRLFTFLKYQNVPATNNQAEQSLRNIVIFRKICFGTRSPEGSYTHSVLPSLLLTAKRQGKHPLAFFSTLLTSDIDTAQAALYRNYS